METIWKYPLEIDGIQNILVPVGARFLSVIEQNDVPVLYFLVNSDLASRREVEILLCGTGQPFLEYLGDANFLGTVSCHNGKLIWHIFTKDKSILKGG